MKRIQREQVRKRSDGGDKKAIGLENKEWKGVQMKTTESMKRRGNKGEYKGKDHWKKVRANERNNTAKTTTE